MHEKLVANFRPPSGSAQHWDTAYRHSAWTLGNTNRHEERGKLFREAIKVFEKLAVEDPMSRLTPTSSRYPTPSGQRFEQEKRPDEAEKSLWRAVEISATCR